MVRIGAEGRRHSLKVKNPVRIIPAQSPIRADDLQAVDRRALEIIDVDSAHRSICELQSDLCNIFDIHFEWGNVSVERPERLHIAKQKTKIIQGMRERDNDATT